VISCHSMPRRLVPGIVRLMTTVTIDGSGFILHPWMAVLVPHRTAVTYELQTGGTGCLPRKIEGYLVPVFDQEGFDSLRSIFEVTLEGAGTNRGVEWSGALLDRLRKAVDRIRMDSSEGGPGEVKLILDESRLTELDEAWVPVKSPDGPATLIWPNSD
jgi:hypothetical protein